MGKGDKKTRRGKITIGSYGVRRPRKKSTPVVIATKAKPKVKPKAVATPKAVPKAKAVAKLKTATKTKTATKAKPKAATKAEK